MVGRWFVSFPFGAFQKAYFQGLCHVSSQEGKRFKGIFVMKEMQND